MTDISSETTERAPREKPADLKIPRSLAQCADLYYQIREARYALDKQAAAMKSKESYLAEHLINNIPKSQADGVIGKVCSATIVKKQKPRVIDWDKLYAYIIKNKAFEMLQRRVSDAAVTERWENGKNVPGVEKYTVLGLSVSARKVK